MAIDRVTPKKVVGVHELDAILVIHAQLALLTKRLDTSNVSAIQIPNSSCESCGGGQASNDSQVDDFLFPKNEQTNYVNNFQRSNNNPLLQYLHSWMDELAKSLLE